jgi:hypothetical protein
VVLHRMITAMEAGRPRHDCPVCGCTRFAWLPETADAPAPGPACRQCGVLTPTSVLAPETLRAAHRAHPAGVFAAA